MSTLSRMLIGFGWLFLGGQEDRLAHMDKPGKASWLVKVLMYFRLLYIFLLPGLAVGSLAIDGKRTSFLFITSVALLYLIRAHATFSFPISLPAALLTALAVPIQVITGALFAGDSVWIFFVEDFFIEATGLFVGLAAVMVNRREKMAGLTCIFLLLLEAANWHAFGRQLLYREGWGIEWAALHISALITAVVVNLRAAHAKRTDDIKYYTRPKRGFSAIPVVVTALVIGIITVAATEVISDHIRSKQKVSFYEPLTEAVVKREAQAGTLDDVRSLFHDDPVGPKGLAALVVLPGFSNVREMTFLDINDDGIAVLAKMKPLVHLEELYLRGHLTHKALSDLFNSQSMPALVSLHITRSKIGDKTIQALVRSHLVQQLVSLDLSENAIKDSGVAILAKAPWPSLETLDLSKNPATNRSKQLLEKSEVGKRLGFLNF